MHQETVDIAIMGAGPVGLACALAFARLGLAATIVAPPHDAARAAGDGRTTALIGPSVDFLKNINVWPLCVDQCADITAVRIADDRGGILCAPELMFRACELGLERFGSNVPNPALLTALAGAASDTPTVKWIGTTRVTSVAPSASHVCLQLAEGGTVLAKLVVAADGRNSLGPAAAGIDLTWWSYPQAAIAVNFHHSRSHDGVVNELHRRTGPLTTVPLPGRQSSLVWVEEPHEAQRIAQLPDETFCNLLEERLQGVLGTIGDASARTVYPLAAGLAKCMGMRRIALVGEAAHVIPPLGAQGLNLGLRDAASLAEIVANAKAKGEDVGAPDVFEAYDNARATDVAARSTGIDLLNRSLLTGLLPLDALRGAATHLMARSSSARAMLMQAGLGTMGVMPRLMRAAGSQASP
jgi:2-octaprenyl-6-methoxyphenol hydroxylase